ncbi:hypothetical protein AMTRI_Chr10g8020 [Amborella trichopoda]|uniref:pentatricopeptide repeat-containing protein At3g24000, mitochondrial n=1 Tax=Amborella trichopoda TaxID=13333 RepID=UPI0005D41310|nr:pentatricopeptide repeat-containing protein At3g24000, mitochondrial [Amborella trichopoda]|eukprot:XP_011628230.1 pentatricopeptide repeat-containing protein At3g24000, mitochondrial [Amborella trichopoda]
MKKLGPFLFSSTSIHSKSPTYLFPLIFSQFSTATPLSSLAESDDSSDSEPCDLSLAIIEPRNLLSKSNSSTQGLHVLDLMDRGSIPVDAETYSRLLKRCTQLGKLKEGKSIHAHILNSKLKSDIFLRNSIINMYAKCGSLCDAKKSFDEMLLRDMVSWTVLITGFAQNDQSAEAVGCFLEMHRSGLKPNQFTFASVFKACGALSSSELGKQVHGFSVKSGCDFNVYVSSSIVDMYTRNGEMGGAHKVFDEMTERNEVCWNALIAGYARKGEGENSLEQFLKMQRAGFEPTHFTYSSVFSGCASIGALEQGKWVHAHMVKFGCRVIAFVANTLMDMYAKSGSIEDAMKVFDRLQKPDVVSWNSILTGLAQHGLGKEAVIKFEEMLKKGIKPNEISFLCVLSACSHAGLINEGWRYFELMREKEKYGIEPKMEHYVSIVDLFGRAGMLDQAERFIKSMPIEPNAAIWGALLGACRMHGNMELGKLAAECVFELDPHDSGPHVLLSNIYAAAGKWGEAARVRKLMKESGVKKEPACSWVEIENSVHMFVANDDTHPQKEDIFKMLDKLGVKLKEAGYVPDTNYVLLYVDKQEREMKLQYHSEKIALAFALLNTPPGATIRIKKNIRVCGDCHNAIKLASKIVEREIIVRDTNRFHHFRDGSCTCGDYW